MKPTTLLAFFVVIAVIISGAAFVSVERSSKPRFYVGEEVRVTGGFYWDCRGTLNNYDPIYHEYLLTDVLCVRDGGFLEFNTVQVKENDLEEITK